MSSKISFKLSRLSLLILFIFIRFMANAQTGLNFQGVARTNNNILLASQPIYLKLSIIHGSASGDVEYTETRKVITDGKGLFSLVIGDSGAISTVGNFSTINWKLIPKFLKIEMDQSGNDNFINMGTTQFQSVAYALYSSYVAAENIDGIMPLKSGGTGVGSLAELKSALLLEKLNNTADTAKPISKLMQAALDLKLNSLDTSRYSKQAFIDSALLTKLKIVDTINLSNRINLKANIDSTSFTKDITVNGIKIGKGGGGSSIRNTILGATALNEDPNNTDADADNDNTAIGYASLYSNLTGQHNTALGVSALTANTSGIQNTAVGQLALSNNINYNNATGIGFNAQVTGSNQIQLGDALIDSVKTYGSIKSKSFVKIGGDSSQYLMADGSVKGIVTYEIGQTANGGIVFWLDDTKTHGLVALATDQSASIKWLNDSYMNTSSIRSGAYEGYANTQQIITSQGTGTYAATLAAQFINGRLGDWYLPSKDELNKLYIKKDIVGGLSGNYWTSTEVEVGTGETSDFAWSENFDTGNQSSSLKSNTYKVRVIRKF